MPRRLGAALLLVGLAAMSKGVAGFAQAPVTAFVNVSLIPMDRERVVPGQTVVVRGDRIVALGPTGEVTVPAGAVRVDGRGKFLLPGFADMHVHLGDTSRQVNEASLLLFVANGVTTVRAMHGGGRNVGDQTMLFDLRRRVAGGELIGPRIYTAGDPDWRSPGEAARSVAELAADGHDFVDIDAGANVAGAPYDSVLAAARRARLRIAGHVPAAQGLMAVLRDHWASIEHLSGYYTYLLHGYDPDGLLDQTDLAARLADTADWMRPAYRPDPARLQALAKATRRAGVWNCPTLRRWHYFDFGAPAVAAVADPVSADLRSSQAKHAKPPIPRDSAPDPSLEPLLRVARRLGEIGDWITQSLQDAGAGLLLGTDTGDDAFPDVPPGFSVAREMQLAVQAGLTPYQALAMGTRNVAAFMGTSDTAGTIALGKRADLVLLDGNPLRDIGQVAGPAGVMVGGRWHARAELDTMLDRLATWKDFDLRAVRHTLWETPAPSP